MTIIEFVRYAKKFVAALAAALVVAGLAVADNTVTLAEWIQIAAAFLGALGVYQLNNTPKEEL